MRGKIERTNSKKLGVKRWKKFIEVYFLIDSNFNEKLWAVDNAGSVIKLVEIRIFFFSKLLVQRIYKKNLLFPPQVPNYVA